MTERERCSIEYERSHRSARRIAALTAIMLLGAMLGYRAEPGPDAPSTYSASAVAP